MVDVAACSANSLEANDDSSAEPITLPFDLDFYTRSYDTLWVNNNGNVTFDGPLSTLTPFGLVGTDAAIIASFFADVDTRASGSVTYGWGTTAWSPDGTRIAFSSSRAGNGDIYSMKPDVGDVGRLTASNAIEAEPSWSPDGSRLAYTSTASGSLDIFTIRPDGSNAQRLTTDPGTDTSPSWAPDGVKIIYSSTRGEHVDLYTSLADGTGTTRLTTSSGIKVTPAWR